MKNYSLSWVTNICGTLVVFFKTFDVMIDVETGWDLLIILLSIDLLTMIWSLSQWVKLENFISLIYKQIILSGFVNWIKQLI